MLTEEVPVTADCPRCGGMGYLGESSLRGGKESACPACGGHGVIELMASESNGTNPDAEPEARADVDPKVEHVAYVAAAPAKQPHSLEERRTVSGMDPQLIELVREGVKTWLGLILSGGAQLRQPPTNENPVGGVLRAGPVDWGPSSDAAMGWANRSALLWPGLIQVAAEAEAVGIYSGYSDASKLLFSVPLSPPLKLTPGDRLAFPAGMLKISVHEPEAPAKSAAPGQENLEAVANAVRAGLMTPAEFRRATGHDPEPQAVSTVGTIVLPPIPQARPIIPPMPTNPARLAAGVPCRLCKKPISGPEAASRVPGTVECADAEACLCRQIGVPILQFTVWIQADYPGATRYAHYVGRDLEKAAEAEAFGKSRKMQVETIVINEETNERIR